MLVFTMSMSLAFVLHRCGTSEMSADPLSFALLTTLSAPFSGKLRAMLPMVPVVFVLKEKSVRSKSSVGIGVVVFVVPGLGRVIGLPFLLATSGM